MRRRGGGSAVGDAYPYPTARPLAVDMQSQWGLGVLYRVGDQFRHHEHGRVSSFRVDMPVMKDRFDAVAGCGRRLGPVRQRPRHIIFNRLARSRNLHRRADATTRAALRPGRHATQVTGKAVECGDKHDDHIRKDL